MLIHVELTDNSNNIVNMAPDERGILHKISEQNLILTEIADDPADIEPMTNACVSEECVVTLSQ